MKRFISVFAIMAGAIGVSNAQTALGAYAVSQPDLKGTARYMGMAGAFGALGGDLSSLSQNPAGIGVYRSSDIGFTLDLDLQKSTTDDGNGKYNMDQTKFLLNNIGGVFTLKLSSETCPNFNFGFTYNKGASFNRLYGGEIRKLKTSMSNYIADTSNYLDVTSGDVSWNQGQNPYEVGYNYFQAPWMNILAAHSGILSWQDIPTVDDGYYTQWYGMWQDAMDSRYDTSGQAYYTMQEQGCTNDFNIVLGGNILDKLYWGMNFDIINLNYKLNTYWSENLTNAYYLDNEGNAMRENAQWDFGSTYSLSGTGFQYQLGLIFKPINELRFGFAFHTPTWYSLNEQFSGYMNYNSMSFNANNVTNDGVPGYTNYNLSTPWRIIASAAGVIGSNFIISFDYEWANYGGMRFSEPTNYGDGYYDGGWYEPWSYGMMPPTRSSYINPGDPYYNENSDITTYYKSTNTFRVGLEFKPVSSLSIRAGYCYVSSPVKAGMKNNQELVYTPSLSPSYRLDNTTNYITAGIGYRYSHIYVDLAYVFKKMDSEYHAFAPLLYDPYNRVNTITNAPQTKVSLMNNQIVLSAGYRF